MNAWLCFFYTARKARESLLWSDVFPSYDIWNSYRWHILTRPKCFFPSFEKASAAWLQTLRAGRSTCRSCNARRLLPQTRCLCHLVLSKMGQLQARSSSFFPCWSAIPPAGRVGFAFGYMLAHREWVSAHGPGWAANVCQSEQIWLQTQKPNWCSWRPIGRSFTPMFFWNGRRKKNLERESTAVTSSFCPVLPEGGTADQCVQKQRLRISQLRTMVLMSPLLPAPLPIRIRTLVWHSLTTSEVKKGRFEDRIIPPLMLLMAKILHELRLVLYPIIYKVPMVQNFFHQQSTVGAPPNAFYGLTNMHPTPAEQLINKFPWFEVRWPFRTYGSFRCFLLPREKASTPSTLEEIHIVPLRCGSALGTLRCALRRV